MITLSLSSAILGTICLASWPIFKSRRGMLLMQLVATATFATHYAVEGVATAAWLNLLGAAQVSCSLLFGTDRRLKWIGYALVPTIAAACVFTWSGLVSILSTTGMILIAIGRVQTEPRNLRLLVLAGAPFWLAHDVLIGSPLAIADLLSILLGLVAVRRAGMPPSLRPLQHSRLL